MAKTFNGIGIATTIISANAKHYLACCPGVMGHLPYNSPSSVSLVILINDEVLPENKKKEVEQTVEEFCVENEYWAGGYILTGKRQIVILSEVVNFSLLLKLHQMFCIMDLEACISVR